MVDDELYARAHAVAVSDMSPLEKLLAYPFADDDQVIHSSQLGTITVGDLRKALAHPRQDNQG